MLLRDSSEIKMDTQELYGMYGRKRQDIQMFRANYVRHFARENRYEIVKLLPGHER